MIIRSRAARAILTAAILILAGASTPAISQEKQVVAPRFVPDPSWPKVPNGWVFGQVSSTASDAKGNIWVLHRPNTVRTGEKTGPPVMEFSPDGTYIKGWGGPGEGYDWPEIEHGIYIDYKGFVWIGGSGDNDNILKFTQDGKFVLQIGHGSKKKSNADPTTFWRPTDVFVYSKTNEIFISDGYRNRRVIVFDADTGAYKRMWGAFGKPPVDAPPGRTSGEGGNPMAGANDVNRVPAKDLPPTDPGPTQFNTVHGVKVSNDGLVYVSDRGGKRVQVFKIDGTYVTQVFVDRWCEQVGMGCGNGQTVASTAFSSDPEQKYLYIASRSPARIWIYDRKTLTPLYSFGKPGIGPGEFYVLHHMTTDAKGNLYTAEVEDGRRVQKFVFKGVGAIPLSLAR